MQPETLGCSADGNDLFGGGECNSGCITSVVCGEYFLDWIKAWGRLSKRENSEQNLVRLAFAMIYF